jgi:uncharacterized protein
MNWYGERQRIGDFMNSTFWVTTKCNMNCKYCYEGEKKLEKAMNVDIADRAIDYTIRHYNDLHTKEPLDVGFHGGEPLLQFELIKYIINKFRDYFRNDDEMLKFSMTTNGVLLTEEISKYICDNIQFLSISLDGTKKTHDTNRVLLNEAGTYDIVAEKFMDLLKKRSDIRVRTTFNSKTVANLSEDVKHLIDMGFMMIVPAPDLFSNDWDTEHMEILYSEMQKIKNLLEAYDKKMDIKVGIVDPTFEDRPKGTCSGGITGIHIDPEGSIYPCINTVGHEEFIVGHINTGINKKKLEEIHALSRIENTQCSGCSRYKYCDGTRCKVINKIMTGDYHTPSAVLCAVENIYHKFFSK